MGVVVVMMRIIIIMTLSTASSGFVDYDADAYDNHGDNSVLAIHKNKFLFCLR